MREQWKRLLGAALLVAAAALGTAGPAAGFQIVGHDVIEGRAYHKIVANEKTERGERIRAAAGTGFPDGHALLEHLIGEHYLSLPYGREPLEGLPFLGSGRADLIFSRQFSSNGQCFHFMAQRQDVRTDEWEVGAPDGVKPPAGMTRDAYQRCISVLTRLVERLLNPPDGDRDPQDTYAVIHMITDSFSDAHSERVKEEQLIYLKPWRLTAWPNLANPLPPYHKWEHFLSLDHHQVFDDRDWDFASRSADTDADPGDPACEKRKHPYLWGPDCISPKGEAAVDAVADFLFVLAHMDRTGSSAERHIIAEDDGRLLDTEAAALWKVFLEAHFKHVLAESRGTAPEKVDFPQQNTADIGWRPGWNFGLSLRPDRTPGDRVAAVVESYYMNVSFLPFQAGSAVAIDLDDGRTGRSPVAVDLLLFRLLVSENVAIGFRPFTVHNTEGYSVTSSSLHADLYFWDWFWLQVQSKRYFHQERVAAQELSDSWAIAIGYAHPIGDRLREEGPYHGGLLASWKAASLAEKDGEGWALDVTGLATFIPSRERSGLGAEIGLRGRDWAERGRVRLALGVSFDREAAGTTEEQSDKEALGDTRMDGWLAAGVFLAHDAVYLGLMPVLRVAAGGDRITGDGEGNVNVAALEMRLHVLDALVLGAFGTIYSYDESRTTSLDELWGLRVGLRKTW